MLNKGMSWVTMFHIHLFHINIIDWMKIRTLIKNINVSESKRENAHECKFQQSHYFTQTENKLRLYAN